MWLELMCWNSWLFFIDQFLPRPGISPLLPFSRARSIILSGPLVTERSQAHLSKYQNSRILCLWLKNSLKTEVLLVHRGAPERSCRLYQLEHGPQSRTECVQWTPHYLETLGGEGSVLLPPFLPDLAPKCLFVVAVVAPKRIFSGGASGKEPACQRRRRKRRGFNTWVGKDPWGKEMATHSSILVWKIPRTDEPVGLDSPQSHKELGMTEYTHIQSIPYFPEQGLNPCPLYLKCGLSTTGAPGKSPDVL